MKKLIPALCMLLVAACLMGTSTYAWFAANTQVTASGMEVKALSSGGLAIGSYNDDGTKVTAPAEADFASSASWTTGDYVRGNNELKPASYNNSYNAPAWYSAIAATADNHAAASGITTVTTTINEHRKEFWWDVKSLKDGNVVDVIVTEVSVAIKDGAEAKSATLDKSLRVAIVTDEASFIFAPLHAKQAGQNEAALVYVASITDGKFTTSTSNLYRGTDTYKTTDDKNLVILTGLGVTAEKVAVYVYYEGEDPNCKSANATNIDQLVVTFKLNSQNERAASNQGT